MIRGPGRGTLLAGVLALALAMLALPAWAAEQEDVGPSLQGVQVTLQERIQAMEQVRTRVQAGDREMLQQMLQETQADLLRLQTRTRERDRDGVEEALRLMEQHAVQHRERLQAMLQRAPGDATPGLQRAITACEQTRTMTMERLRFMERDQERAERTDRDVMRPSEMRPPGMGQPGTVPGMGSPHGPGGMGGGGMTPRNR